MIDIRSRFEIVKKAGWTGARKREEIEMKESKRIRKMPDGQTQKSFQLPIEMLEALKAAAERQGGASVGSLVRKAINDLLAKEEKSAQGQA